MSDWIASLLCLDDTGVGFSLLGIVEVDSVVGCGNVAVVVECMTSFGELTASFAVSTLCSAC